MLSCSTHVTLENVVLAGVAACVPKQTIHNDYFETSFHKDVIKSVSKMTGVENRRWADSATTSGKLCLESAKLLLKDLDWDSRTVDALIFISQTPDFLLPPTAMAIHKDLQLSHSCIAFDVNLGCSGYPYGLWIGSMMLQSPSIKRVLVLAGDTISKILDPVDRSTAMLFGDAGSATALEYVEGAPNWYFCMGTDGHGVQNLVVPESGFSKNFLKNDLRLVGKTRDKLFMDGSEVFNFTLKVVPLLINQLSENFDGEIEQFYFHQANLFMLNHLRKKLKINEGAMPTNIQRFGNTSVASIPLLFVTEDIGNLHNINTAFVGFGVGYSWSAVAMPCNRRIKKLFLEL